MSHGTTFEALAAKISKEVDARLAVRGTALRKRVYWILVLAAFVSVSINLKGSISLLNPASAAAGESVQTEEAKLASNLRRSSTAQSEETPQAATPAPFRSQGLSAKEIVEVATLSGVSISPDQHHVAVRLERPNVESNGISLEWLLVKLADRRVVARIPGGFPDYQPSGDLKREASFWSNDSQKFYYMALDAQGSRSVWEANLDGQSKEIVTGAADVEQFRFDCEKDRILYSIGPTRDELREIQTTELEQGVVLDGSRDVIAPLTRNMPYGIGMGTIHVLSNSWHRVGDPGERSAFAYETRSNRRYPVHLGELTVTDNAYENLNPEFRSAAIAATRSALSGDTAFISHSQPDFRDSFGRNTSSLVLGVITGEQRRQVRRCADRRCSDLTGALAWRPGTAEIVFTTADSSGAVGMHAWDVARDQVRSVFRARGVLGPGIVDFQSGQCPLTESFSVCVLEVPSYPPRLVRIGLDDGEVHTLFDPNLELRKRIGYDVRELSWPDRRKLKHTGVLVLPAGRNAESMPPPLVITSYVCRGFLRGGTGGTVPEYTLAANGIAALCINLDDAASAPGYPNVPAGQATRLQYLLDGWEGAVEFLKAQNLIDAGRVGISGLSFTGEAVHHVLTHSRMAAAATSGHMPLLDASNYYTSAARGNVGRAIIDYYGLQDPASPAGRSYYQSVSPALNADGIAAPLLVQTDEAEFRLGLEYLGALRLRKKPAEFIVFPDESHLFWQPRHRWVMAERNVDWFRFWLLDETDSSEIKRAQYARWEKLRQSRIDPASTPRILSDSSDGAERTPPRLRGGTHLRADPSP